MSQRNTIEDSQRTECTEYTECTMISTTTLDYDDDGERQVVEEGANNFYWEEERATVVRFSNEVVCKGIISRSEITAEEAIAAWYTDAENEKLMDKYARTCERRRSGKRPKKNSTYRGLETFDEDDALEFQYTVESCVDAVLLEQERQFSEGIVDWEIMAEISREFSEPCMEQAVDMGKSDEREAKKAVRQMTSLRQDSYRSLSSYSVEPTQDLKTLRAHKASQETAIIVRPTSPILELRTMA